MAAAIAQGREERKALLNKVAGTLALPPTMHLHQLIKTDTPESLLPRLSEKRTSWCSVMIIRRLAGTCRTETCLLACPPRDTLPSVSADRQLLVVGGPYRGPE